MKLFVTLTVAWLELGRLTSMLSSTAILLAYPLSYRRDQPSWSGIVVSNTTEHKQIPHLNYICLTCNTGRSDEYKQLNVQ